MFEKISAIIEAEFKTGIEASSASAVEVRWPNVPWKQPANSEWLSFFIVPGDGEQASLGSGKLERQYGLVMVQIFTPKNGGSRRSKVLADIVAGIFRYKTLTDGTVNVVLRAPMLTQVGGRVDIYQDNVRIEFEAERIFS